MNHDPQTIHHILDLFPAELSVNPDINDLSHGFANGHNIAVEIMRKRVKGLLRIEGEQES